MTGDVHPAVIEDRFRIRAGRRKAWGTGLLIVAGLCWVYAAFQLFTPYETRIWSVDCSGPAFADREGVYDVDGPLDERERREIALCAESRDWPAPVTALLIGAPLAAAGGSLRTAGSVALDLREHTAQLTRADR
ncbi:hypothetical protein OKJ48_41750 [Streptomyces kunmingensis]|uniref:Uncharacterized protein n=1 Tax=Streptomyces kunmingensis TaxID=68225 RepID=A0ABU6CR63_9ACTN|nr:hypothetical protein [Streptomyces kunmingensis]MEB3966711.1 hypothetical protein [Streptomyces kunmingensis]